MAETSESFWHPWLRVQRILRTVLTEEWNVKEWARLEHELPKLFGEQWKIRRAGWFN